MPPDAQPPTVTEPVSIIENHLPDIHGLVRLNCLAYHNLIDSHEVEDLCQEIVLLLIKEDCRRLRSFDCRRSSLRTWLAVVVRNHINNYARRRRTAHSLEDVPPVVMICHATQEGRVISDNLLERVRAVTFKLSEREQRLLELLCSDEMDASGAAQLMGIKVDSLHRCKHVLIKKLRRLVGEQAH